MSDLTMYESEQATALCRMLERIAKEGISHFEGVYSFAEVVEIDKGEIDILVKWGVEGSKEEADEYTISRLALSEPRTTLYEKYKRMYRCE